MTTENGSRNEAEERALHDLKQAEGDLKRAEKEVEEAVKELEAARHDDDVTIVVDGVDCKVHGKKWIVRDLKKKLEIDQAKVLAQITPQGLKDLDDNAQIELHEKEQFMTHARSGGSS